VANTSNTKSSFTKFSDGTNSGNLTFSKGTEWFTKQLAIPASASITEAYVYLNGYEKNDYVFNNSYVQSNRWTLTNAMGVGTNYTHDGVNVVNPPRMVDTSEATFGSIYELTGYLNTNFSIGDTPYDINLSTLWYCNADIRHIDYFCQNKTDGVWSMMLAGVVCDGTLHNTTFTVPSSCNNDGELIFSSRMFVQGGLAFSIYSQKIEGKLSPILSSPQNVTLILDNSTVIFNYGNLNGSNLTHKIFANLSSILVGLNGTHNISFRSNKTGILEYSGLYVVYDSTYVSQSLNYSPSSAGNYSWNISCNSSMSGNSTSSVNRNFIYDNNISIFSPADNYVSKDRLVVLFNYSESGSLQCGLNVDGSEVARTNVPNYTCYQETTSNATSCGGLSSGSYSVVYGFSPTNNNWRDGDWDTFTDIQVGGADPSYYYSSYSVPYNARTNLSSWLIKVFTSPTFNNLNEQLITYNLSLLNCDVVAGNLTVRVYQPANDAGFYGQCLKGGVWSDLQHFHLNTNHKFYEEAIYFDMRDVWMLSYSPTVSGNYSWNVSCNNSMSAGSLSSLNRLFVFDVTFPVVSFVSPSDSDGSSVSRRNVLVNVSVYDEHFANLTVDFFRNGVLLNSTTSNQSVLFQNFSGLANAYYQFNVSAIDTLGNRVFSARRNVSVNNLAPVISGIHLNKTGVDVDNLYLFNNFVFVSAISDPENDVLQVNYSIVFPNGTSSVYNASMVGVNFTSQGYVAVNGTYRVNVSASDGFSTVNLSKNFSVVDVMNVTSLYSPQIIPAGQNLSFNILVESYTGESVFFNSSCGGLNPSYFGCVFVPNPVGVSGNATVGVTVTSVGLTPVGNYSGFVLVNRSLDGRLYNLSINFSVSSAFGIPVILNKSDWSVSIDSASSTSQNFVLLNNGTFALSECRPTLDADFTSWTFISYSQYNFSLGIGLNTSFSVTFTSPPPATYRGHLNVQCVATPSGSLNSLEYSNQPYVQLVSTQAVVPVIPVGGGGGGNNFPQTVIVGVGGNESLFTVSTDTGEPSASLLMYPSQKRTVTFIVKSNVDKSLSLKLSCVGTFCGNVDLLTSQVIVYPRSQELVTADILVPEGTPYGSELVFKIVAEDESKHSSVVQMGVQVNRFTSWYSKFSPFVRKGDSGFWFAVGSFGVPKLLLYLLAVIVFEFLVFFALPKGKKYQDLGTILYLFVGVMAFVVTSIIF